MEESVFNPNPFIRVGNGAYELPKRPILDNWVTEEFGFEMFKSGNELNRWLYIEMPGVRIMATPEAFDDKNAIRGYFNYITQTRWTQKTF